MNKKRLTILFLVFSCVFIFGYLYLDYNNCFTALGYDFNRFNVPLMGIVINSLLTVVLFAIAYVFVDKRNETRQRNKGNVLKLMLVEAYNSCLNGISIIESLSDNKKAVYINNSYQPIDFTERDELFKTLEREPFDNEHIIIDLFKEGSLPETEYIAFTENKKKYLYYIFLKSNRIPNLNNNNVDNIREELKKRIADAKSKLDLEED